MGRYRGARATDPRALNSMLSVLPIIEFMMVLDDLLKVVNLNNINHENICCLNTAIFITIFAHRRRELHVLLRNLKRTDDYEAKLQHEADDAILRKDQMMDNTISRAMTNMYID